MKSTTIAILLAVVVVGGTVSSGLAAPVYNPSNGHYYERFDVVATWSDAWADANARTYNGQAGHLATITSEGENTFITNNLLDGAPAFKYWLGGFQPAGSPEPDGNWQWVTGEPFSYTNWFSGQSYSEPNNDGGDEDALQIMSNYASSIFLGKWNDYTGGETTEIDGYIVEYLPEPGTVSLLMLGALALIRRRRA